MRKISTLAERSTGEGSLMARMLEKKFYYPIISGINLLTIIHTLMLKSNNDNWLLINRE